MPIDITRVDVCVTVIFCGDRLLTIYNEPWGAFTLPMTKLRRQRPDLLPGRMRWERGQEAALRNVAECLHATVKRPPVLLMDFGNLAQSDHDGKVKHYAFQIYAYEVERPEVGAGVAANWLTAAEILDPDREPISPTARTLVGAILEQSLSRKCQVPPSTSGPPERTSVASVAIMKRTHGGQSQWLTQWNEKWQRYFLVGGHQHDHEIPEQCMRRELQEELQIEQQADYEPYVRQLLSYDAWSTSKWQWTHYDITTFDIELKPSGERKFSSDIANRWLRLDELQSECCDDGKLISPTARTVLSQLGELPA